MISFFSRSSRAFFCEPFPRIVFSCYTWLGEYINGRWVRPGVPSFLKKFSNFVPLNRFKCRPNKFRHDLALGGHFIIPVGGSLSGYFGVT
jgi:hypothetical protein